MNPTLAALRLRRDVEAVHRLGVRPVYEMVLEIGKRTYKPDLVAEIVADFASINPEFLCALGGHRFPAGPVRVIGRAR